nr:alpha/beta hydrolase [Luteimonas salinisoli]
MGVAALAWLAVCVLLYLQQRSLVYYPQFTRSDPAETDFSLDRGDAVLRGWIVNPGRGDALLYFGGNAERVEDNRDALADWAPARTGYLPAYRGYGASDGTPGEALLLADALALYDLVRQRHPEGGIAVVGRSLGSAVAAHVAAHRDVERLALVTPFDSMVEVARGHYPWLPVRWLMRERYDTASLLPRHEGPVLVLRAGADTVVPPRHADRLVAAQPRQPMVRNFPGAGHNDIHLHPGYDEAIAGFLR